MASAEEEVVQGVAMAWVAIHAVRAVRHPVATAAVEGVVEEGGHCKRRMAPDLRHLNRWPVVRR